PVRRADGLIVARASEVRAFGAGPNPAARAIARLAALAALALASLAAHAATYEVVVEDPYLELHTGPGRGYPVFHIAERGERVELIRRRTDWFQVRVPRGEVGWVPLAQLRRTLGLDGEPFDVPAFELADYTERRWEVGALYGDFGGANVISVYGAFGMTPNLSLELWLSQALGRFSDSKIASLDIVHE